MFNLTKSAISSTILCGVAASLLIPQQQAIAASFDHVLILSVDGLRSADLQDPTLQQYIPNIRTLKQRGITYPHAYTTSPSDSFPGTLSIFTGATAKTTGVYYDDTYARNLIAPSGNGGNINSSLGTEAQYAENVDYSLPDPSVPANQRDNSTVIWTLSGSGYANGGFDASGNPVNNPTLITGNYGAGSIDVTRLPQDCSSGTCNPVYPQQYVQNGVNNILDVVHNAGLKTAFSDKHPGAYTIIGHSADEVYSPEINASVALVDSTSGQQINEKTATSAQLHLIGTQLADSLSPSVVANPANYSLKAATDNIGLTIPYDTLKVNGIINEFQGKNPLTGASSFVPNLTYMNFQAVSVAEKALNGGIDNTGANPLTNPKAVGNTPPGGPTNTFLQALQATDASIGKILDTISQQGLDQSTLVVLTAKHGQSPRTGVGTLLKGDLIPDAIDFYLHPLNDKSAVNQATQDDVSLIWLQDQSKIADVTSYLQGLATNPNLPLCDATSAGSTITAPICNPGIAQVYSGSAAVASGLAPSATPDNRTPDLFIQLIPGYIFVGNPAKGKKIAEHGGLFTQDDTNIALIVSSAGLDSSLQGTSVINQVNTTQIAPTVLAALGLNPKQLVGANLEGTQALPVQTVPEPTSPNGLLAFFGLLGTAAIFRRQRHQ